MGQSRLLLRSTPSSSEIPPADLWCCHGHGLWFFYPISDATVSRHQFGSDIAWPAHHFYWQMTFLFNRNKTNKTRRHCSLAWLAMQKPLGLLQTWYWSFLWHGYLFLKERKKESTTTTTSARWQISSKVWSLAAIPSRFPIRLLPHWALGLTSGASKRQLSARAINNQLCFDSSLIFVRLLLART